MQLVSFSSDVRGTSQRTNARRAKIRTRSRARRRSNRSIGAFAVSANSLHTADDHPPLYSKSQYSVVDGTCTLSSCGSRDYLDDGQCLNCEDLVHFSLSCSKAAGATSWYVLRSVVPWPSRDLLTRSFSPRSGAYTSLWNATCIAYCPPGTYTKDTVCVDCQDDSAVTCNQEGALSCSTSTFLTPNETCTTNCGDGFWGNGESLFFVPSLSPVKSQAADPCVEQLRIENARHALNTSRLVQTTQRPRHGQSCDNITSSTS